MSNDAVLISVSLLVVALAIIALAVAVLKARKRSVDIQVDAKRPQAEPVVEADDETDDEGDQDLDAVVAMADEPLQIVKKIDLPNGQIEILVQWDPNRDPSAFRGQTLDEAMENARSAIATKRAMQGGLDF
jgi:hypothetical protein